MPRCCFDCDFFQLDGKDFGQITEDDWDLGRAEGECRYASPLVGELVTLADGSDFRTFGEFPRVLGTDWCGRFQPRAPEEVS